MTDWRPIFHLPVPTCLSKKLTKAADGLNRRIDELAADREALDNERQQVRADRLDNATETKEAAGRIRERHLELLAAEINLRQELADWLEAYHAELATVAAESGNAVEAVRSKVKRAFDDIGSQTGPVACNVNVHPAVRQAKVEFNATCGMRDDTSHRTANAAALKAARTELESMNGTARRRAACRR